VQLVSGLVQLVSASSPSHQVLGSKPSLCRISAGVRLCFGYSLSQTPLVWESLALGLPLFITNMLQSQMLWHVVRFCFSFTTGVETPNSLTTVTFTVQDENFLIIAMNTMPMLPLFFKQIGCIVFTAQLFAIVQRRPERQACDILQLLTC
jgi:hypothetical protein